MLARLKQEVDAACERGEPEVRLQIIRVTEAAGISLRGTTTRLEKDLNISGAEVVSLFNRLCREEYVLADFAKSGGVEQTVVLHSLSTKGLIEIGDLPDPQQRFLMGLEAAIRMIRDDQSLAPEEKKRKIDWLEEGKFIIRTSGVEVAKALWRGDLPLMGG